jgi:hypothetical protein
MPFDFNADHHRARWAVAVALLALSTSTQSIATPAEDASAVASLDIE